MRCRAYPVFLSPEVSRPVTLLHILHQIDATKYKNVMSKSRQNNSGFSSVVGLILLNLFLVVHLGNKFYFGKERQYTVQNSMFSKRFHRMSALPDTTLGKCRNEFNSDLKL